MTETIDPADDVLKRYGDSDAGCTGLVFEKHGIFSSISLHIRDLVTLSLANQHCNYNSTLPPQAPGIFKLEINRS
jgi:hypothetical protein